VRLSRSREQQGSPPALAKKIKKTLRAQRENRPGETLLLAAGKIRLRTREPKPRKHQENEVQPDLSGEEDKSFGSRHKNQSGYQTTPEIQAGQITNRKLKPWRETKYRVQIWRRENDLDQENRKTRIDPRKGKFRSYGNSINKVQKSSFLLTLNKFTTNLWRPSFSLPLLIIEIKINS
jgi:hypothetical protein